MFTENIQILVCLILKIVLVSGQCLPEGERIEIDPSLGNLKLQHYDYTESLIITSIAKILLNERLGIEVSISESSFTYDQVYLSELNNNEFDANVAVYEQFDTNEFQNLEKTGNIGYTEQSGWYIPSYLAKSNPSTATYLGFEEVYENTDLYCQLDNRDLEAYQNFQMKTNSLLSTTNCDPDRIDMTQEESIACLKVIDNFDDFPRKCPLQFFSPPNNTDWSFNAQLLANNNYHPMLNISYADEDSDITVDTQLYEYTEKNINEKVPFMVHLYEPSASLAADSNFALIRTMLPKYTQLCKDVYTDSRDEELYNCDYHSENLVKVLNKDLKTRLPVAYRFLSAFTITGNEDLNNMLYAEKTGEDLDQIACDYLLNNRASWESSIPKQDQSVRVELSETARIVMMVVASLFVLFAACNAILVIVYKKNINVKSASFPFLLLISLGAMFSFTYATLLFSEPSKAVCVSQLTMEFLGFFTVMLALCFKTLRISILFKLSRPSKMQRKTIRHMDDVHLLSYFSLSMVLFIVYLLIFIFVAPPEPKMDVISITTQEDSSLLTEYSVYCQTSEDIFQILFVVFQLVLIALGTALAISIRKTPSAFNESTHIGAAMYNMFMCVVIKSVVLYLTNAGLQTRLLVDSIFTIFSITVIVALVVTKKFYYILRGWVPDLSKIFQSSSNSKKNASRSARSAPVSRSASRAAGTNRSKNDRRTSISQLKIYKEDGTEKTIVIEKDVEPNAIEIQQQDVTEETLVHVYDGC